MKFKARLDAISPKGAPRHFVVNTGAETVESGMKAVLLSRVRSADTPESGCFVSSFDGAFHGRTLGCLLQRPGHLPLLQYPASALETSINNARSIGLALRDSGAKRIVAYAFGSPLENYDEEGVQSDPRSGDGNTFYLQAMATLPSINNDVELEGSLLDAMREHANALGYEYLSTLIEAKVRDRAPAWMRQGTEPRAIDDDLGSAVRFVYLHVALKAGGAAEGSPG